MAEERKADILPEYATPQHLRAELLMELEMAGVTQERRDAIMGMVNTLIAESLVVTAAELLRGTPQEIRWTLTDAQDRLLPKRLLSGEELLARVSADVATRSAAIDSYNNIQKLLREKSKPAPVPTSSSRPSGPKSEERIASTIAAPKPLPAATPTKTPTVSTQLTRPTPTQNPPTRSQLSCPAPQPKMVGRKARIAICASLLLLLALFLLWIVNRTIALPTGTVSTQPPHVAPVQPAPHSRHAKHTR